MALCALALAGYVSPQAKTITDIPTHLLGDQGILAANMRGKEEYGMISLRTAPVHAWVRVTHEKILMLGREPHSDTDFVEENLVTFFGSGTPHKINLK